MKAQEAKENTFQGNAISWSRWEKAAELVGLNPYYALVGGETFADRLANQLTPPVLDVGCGWGGLLYKLGEKTKTGFDISNYCVQKARNTLQDVPNTSLFQADLLQVCPEKIGKFSTVIALDVLPLVEKAPALDQISNLTSRNGEAIFTDYFAPSSLGDLLTLYGGKQCNKDNYLAAIENAGLEITNLADRTDTCIEETAAIMEAMKKRPVREWIIEQWGESYYDSALTLGEDWLDSLRSRNIIYFLARTSKTK